MAHVIRLPKLVPMMKEGTVAKWLKTEGEQIEPGEPIAEIETDKANLDFFTEERGVLLKRLVGEGKYLQIDTPLAILGEPGEDISALLAELEAQSARSEPS